jgi:tetratricopeptide (TPR) repeat protein
MSDQSNGALKLLQSTGDARRALELAIEAVDRDPKDWHCHYAVGICFRQLKQYTQACEAYENSLKLSANQPSVLLSLAIARQLECNYELSVLAAKQAIDLDPDYFLAFNTLGMTRKLQGEFELALKNYEAGAKIIGKVIARSLNNQINSQIFPEQGTTHNLWLEYALHASLVLAIESGLDRILVPNSDQFQNIISSNDNGGLFWKDQTDIEGKLCRLFFPNFFNAMFVQLKKEPAFCTMIGNQSTVLNELGRFEDAEKHRCEAEELYLV